MVDGGALPVAGGAFAVDGGAFGGGVGTFIDSFEGDLSAYTMTGGAQMSTHYEVVDESTVGVDAVAGSRVLRIIGANSSGTFDRGRIYSLPGDGLADYFEYGQQMTVHVACADVTAAGDRFHHRNLFGYADVDNYLDASIDWNGGQVGVGSISASDGQSYSRHATASFSPSSNTWYLLRITWDDGSFSTAGDVTVDVEPAGGGTPLASVTYNTTVNTGNAGIAWRGFDNHTDYYNDAARVVA